jgi:hypothetical protein
VTAEDTRIVLRTGGTNEPIVDHPRQPADYIHPFPDGPVWSWYQEWRVVGGIRLRVYEVVVSIVLRRFHVGGFDDLVVDHPGQPADYTHTDGTVWTWKQRWRLAGVVQDGIGQDDKERAFGRMRRHLRVYDLVAPGTDR